MSKATNTPLLEWIASSVGFLLLALLVGVIGYDAIATPSHAAPAIVVLTERPVKTATGFVIPFRALNKGRQTAAAVQIEGQLLDGEKLVETSLATLDYVPGHGAAVGGLFYSRDPGGSALRVRALGYQQP